MTDQSRSLGRRTLLGALAAGASVPAGCLERLRSTVSREPLEQVSLTVKTVPADADLAAVRIARELAKNLERAGVDAEVLPVAEEELLRDVLVNGDYDLFVARYPAHEDADYLRGALHSSFVEEPGWQNPFGYVNLDVDELLVEQRRAAPGERESALASLRETFLRDSPFAAVAYPDEPHAMRADRFAGWFDAATHSKLGYLSLRRLNDAPDPPPGLRVGVTDGRATRNRNPLSVEFRDRGVVTNLLYDSLGQRFDGRVEPWLAAAWTWTAEPDRPAVEVTLREGLQWHDGTPLTARDVAFTYRFLADTNLDDDSMEVPAPRFRGRITLVESAEALDERTVRLEFVPTSRPVAARALTVPVLPEHIWRDRMDPANIAGVPLREYATEALVSNNADAVGSGPFRFEQASADEFLELRRFEDHFLRTDAVEGAIEYFADKPEFERLRFVVVPSPGAALELLEAGELDLVATALAPDDVPRVGRDPVLRLSVDRMTAYYHVGFNARRPPLGNPRFRRVVARLLDRDHVAADVFEGYAEPSTDPFARTEQAVSIPDSDEEESLSFPGNDGELDVEAARDLFREAGFSYRDGVLVSH